MPLHCQVLSLHFYHQGRNPTTERGNLESFHRFLGQFSFFLLMPLDMFKEMIRPDESSSAGGADKLLLPGVGSLVTGELVTAGEYLVTVRIRTVEGFLP